MAGGMVPSGGDEGQPIIPVKMILDTDNVETEESVNEFVGIFIQAIQNNTQVNIGGGGGAGGVGAAGGAAGAGGEPSRFQSLMQAGTQGAVDASFAVATSLLDPFKTPQEKEVDLATRAMRSVDIDVPLLGTIKGQQLADLVKAGTTESLSAVRGTADVLESIGMQLGRAGIKMSDLDQNMLGAFRDAIYENQKIIADNRRFANEFVGGLQSAEIPDFVRQVGNVFNKGLEFIGFR